MADSVEALSQCCETTMAKVKRIKMAVDAAEQNYKKFSIHALKLYVKTVDSAYAEYNDFQNRIYLTDPSRKDEFEPYFIDFEELYEYVRIVLSEMIEKYEDDQRAIADITTAERERTLRALKDSNDSGASSSHSQPRMHPSLLLQQMPLPTFDGQYEHWYKFKARFCDIIDKCIHDSPATKLHYLDKALVGEAKGVIDEQTLNDNNYEGAWQILIDRFENLSMVIHGHVTKLLNLKAMTKDSTQELKTLLDDCTKRVESLEFHNLKMDKMAEAIIITLLTSKLDTATRRSWESSVEHGVLPVYKDTIAFLRKHCHVLERCEQAARVSVKMKNLNVKTSIASTVSKTHTATIQKTEYGCVMCGIDHKIDACEEFKKLTVDARYKKAKQLGLCFACLKKGHRTATCKIGKDCLLCAKKHHALMHPEDRKPFVDDAALLPPQASGSGAEHSLTAAKCSVPFELGATKQILLATAEVMVYDCYSELHKCRVLLDSGAMANFVSERMVDLLRLRRVGANIPVIGVNGMKTTVKFKVNAKIASRTSKCEFSLDYLVVPKVTGRLPAMKIDSTNWQIPPSLILADPRFFDPSRIDMLIGAEIFFSLMQEGKIRLAANLPVLQESLLGWLVSGPISDAATMSTVKVCQAVAIQPSNDELNDLLKRFWIIDQQENEVSSVQDDDCEQHFMQTYRRQNDGRFVVMLPLRDNATDLGDSKEQAMKRFAYLERKLDKCPEMRKMYVEFINEYLSLGHCRVVDEHEVSPGKFYLPHHCVMKLDSSTTKLRVVFDASAKSTTDLSLNDVMLVGPTVQDSLFNIILRFRLHKYVFTADVPKMYRQVIVDNAHRKYQRILWREARNEPIKELELNTVTYGTAAAPFLATRSIIQLARDEREDFPVASEHVQKSFYVDDVLTGANTLEEAKQLQLDLIGLLHRGGFDLHKWCANDKALLVDIPIEAQEKYLKLEDSSVNGLIKTLGILWDPDKDDFMFCAKPMEDNTSKPTKRSVLSEVARLFDPLGLLAPITIIGKLVMQQLWKAKIEWDEQIPEEQFRVWKRLRSELCDISSLKIKRRITMDDAVVVELHGFADASDAAYGCCIYLRNEMNDGTATVRLICSKSKVAPIKETQRSVKTNVKVAEMTTPRLELCAAELLANQMKEVCDSLAFDPQQVVLWSDSKIVLCWLDRMKLDIPVFVKNRVIRIRQLFPRCMWRYVSTKANPADLVSRGVFPAALMQNELWWDGPEFLRNAKIEDDAVVFEVDESDESVVAQVATIIPECRPYDNILACSNFRQLQRVFSYVARFVNNCRVKDKSCRRYGKLNAKDLSDGLITMVIIVQQAVYHEEIDCILKGKPIKGKLKNLNPIYDENEKLLRVGGRISNSDLPRNQKHPMILPEKNHFTNILIEDLHREYLHVGLNGLLAAIRQNFWPVNAKRTIHRILKRCITCFRANPREPQQFMGDLPDCRVTPADPFSRTGVDYAGPFVLKVGRGKTRVKSYVSLFVCMVTKAIHLELVTSLSTEGFLAVLHRFVGRRGNPSEMYSDNGTNFRGAERQLAELKELLNSQILEKKINQFCQSRGISWHFNPPKAPHQGGLWEANVKCMKTHLYKVLNESYLTYEEMITLLAQIEAILNSRPLIQLTDDPFDYRALSPGHFLIGRELTAIAEPQYNEIKETTLSRYQLVQKRKQSFWRRWSNEYLTGLQRRSKWFKTPTLLRNGLLVILKEDNMPPQTWKLGRIVETYPGKDGVIRVVTVRTTDGIYRRPTTQIAVLPIDDRDSDEN